MRLTLILALLPLPAMADLSAVIDHHILPATTRFATASQVLAEAARVDCGPQNLRPAYQQAFDAWMGLSHLTFGPLEQDGRGLTIEFWPDPRGLVRRTTASLIAEADPVVDNPAAFSEVSIAGRGLMALERLLYEDSGDADYACRYTRAATADLAELADQVKTDWTAHADLMRSAGSDGNSRYLSASEPRQVLYTALLSALEFDADERLGRPMGSFDTPRPKLAEAWRSDRPLANIRLSLTALRQLSGDLSNSETPVTDAAFDTAQATAEALDDPRLASVATPQGRLQAEILQQQIRAIRDAVEAEIGGDLGLTAGFNSQDGD